MVDLFEAISTLASPPGIETGNPVLLYSFQASSEVIIFIAIYFCVIIASNRSSVVVKNKYDGIYDVIGGSIIRNSATGPDAVLGGAYVTGLTMELSTINGNTCAFAPQWKDGSAVGGIAATKVAISETADIDGNFPVTITSSNASLKNTPATINSYNPVTKTFVMSFDWGAAPSTRIVGGLTLKYKKPRP